MDYNGKDYIINNINVHCPNYVTKIDNNGRDRFLSEGEKLCDLIDDTRSKAIYNLSRMEKLNDEYKCSSTYHLTKSDDNHRPMPNCYDPTYNVLTNKFLTASHAVSEVRDQLSSRHINTYSAKSSAQNSIDSLSSLKSFTEQNLNKVNSAFEAAQYDTNAAGVGSLLATFFTGGLGFVFAVGNAALYNNEFNGKISRAYDSAVEVNDNLSEIGEIISHYHSDIYV